MYGEVYIEYVFVSNLLLDYFLLRLVVILFKSKTGRMRCLLAAVIGAVFSCLILIISDMMYKGDIWNLWLKYIMHSVCAMWMIRIGCGLKKWKVLVKGMLVLYLSAFLWGGFWEVLLTEKSIGLKTFFITALFTYGGLCLIVFVFDAIRVKRKNIYPITLMFQGKTHEAYGFYDTGNFLTEPYSGKPVSIIEKVFLEEILSKNIVHKLENILDKQGELGDTEIAELHPCFIPYRTIGIKQGIMLIITLDELCIHTPKEVLHITKPVLGIVQEPSALEKECKVLLNSRFINQEGD